MPRGSEPRPRRPRVDVPDAELAVLKLLWERRSATIRELTDVLYPRGNAAAYATVQKLLDRLEERRCVRRARAGRRNVYSPAVSREQLIDHRLREAAEKLCEGSMTPLLTQLVDGGRLSPGDVQALRDLVDRLDRGKGS
jgi:predicted transcriptional regulator